MIAYYSRCYSMAVDDVPCYRCGDDTILSCNLCGVFVCGECCEWDEDEDSVCPDCVAHGCKQHAHFHNTNWQYIDKENEDAGC